MYDYLFILLIIIISVNLNFTFSIFFSIFLALISFFFKMSTLNIFTIEQFLRYNFNYLKLFNLFFPSISFILISYFLSYYAGKRKLEIDLLKEEVEKLKKNNKELIEKFKKVDEARVVLEKKFLRDEDFSLKLYHAISNLARLSAEEIKVELLKITKEFINAKALAFYNFNNKKFYLKSKFPEDFNCVELITPEDKFYHSLINEPKVLTVKDELQDNEYHILMASILTKKDGDIIGAIFIFDIDFIDLNATNVKLFSMICNWGGIEIEKALQLALYESEHIKFKGRDIFNYIYFLKSISAEFYKVKRYSLFFSVLVLQILDFNEVVRENLPDVIEEIGIELKRRLRVCDLIFYNDVREDSFIVLLPQTNLSGAEVVKRYFLQRFKEVKIYPYYDKNKQIKIKIETFYIDKDTSDEVFDNFLISLAM